MDESEFDLDIVIRYEDNPILTSADFPVHCNAVFNAAAVKYNGEYILLVRAEGLDGKSRFFLARSKDGYTFELSSEPIFIMGNKEPFKTYEKRGVEDPRITRIDNTYYILYTAYSHFGPCVAVATTKDFTSFNKIAIISEPNNKDAVLFPKKFDEKFVRLDRPAHNSIWISYSSDLRFWGEAKAVMEPRPGYWEMDWIGAGAPPIETTEGWLEIYHGVKNNVYRLGCALLHLEDPSRLIGRSETPILSPRTPYERTGNTPNVVFTCGAIFEKDRNEIRIYYGAADTCVCVCTAKMKNLIKLCLTNNK